MSGHALLFTDLVDSTLLVERLGDARAAQVFAEHDRRARDLLVQYRGREIDRTDGFFVLFADVSDAASFALAYQAALQGLELRARSALHVGSVLLRENPPDDVAHGAKRTEVEGIAKPVAARVVALARGGQTLLTGAARAALGDALGAGAEIESHGHYRLKGIAEPLEVFELGVRGQSAFVPPDDVDKAYRVVWADGRWAPVREVRHNLPRERDAFVGRDAYLAALAARLDAGARLVTVLGPGGTGKTRFVRRYAWGWLGDWPGGVFFCDLSEARTLDGVFFVVAVALGVPLGKDDPGVRIGHAMATRGRCLIVLDNFEQLVDHAHETVGRWLDRAGDATFVVTSRERLHVPGEDVLPLEPLAVDAEGMELFALRARAQRADFSLTPANRAAVQQIVTLLDGLPLAIELAAARMRVMSAAQLVERLSDRFRLLAGSRGAAARQATLRGAIDWSWDLLAAWEQAALAQCSVFEGGFTLEAAEAVLDLSPWTEAPPAMDAVHALVDKSLLRTWVPLGQVRHDIDEPYFGMYLSIHDYAAEKLSGSGPLPQRAAQDRHGDYFARFGSDEGIASLYRHGGDARLRALALELDNLVTACRRAIEYRRSAAAIGSYRATWEVLERQGPFELGRELGSLVAALDSADPSLHAAAWMTRAQASIACGQMEQAGQALSRALALARAAADPNRMAIVLALVGIVERMQGRMSEARPHLDEALGIAEQRGDRYAEALVLVELGILHRETGAMDEAQSHYERALALHREAGNRHAECKVMSNLAIVHAQQGRAEAARSHFEGSLAIGRELGDRRREGLVLGNLGVLESEQGASDLAAAHYEAALAIHRDTGDRREEGIVLGNLGEIHQRAGRAGEARAMFGAALEIAREVANRRHEGHMLGMLGLLERDHGQLDDARAHFEQALALHRAVGNRPAEAAVLAYLGGLGRTSAS